MVERWSMIGVVLAIGIVTAGFAQGPARLEVAPQGKALLALRSRGPDGLSAVLRRLDEVVAKRDELARQDHPGATASKLEHSWKQIESEVDRWSRVVDQVGAQRGCSVSRLYWYTDLGAAQAEAVRTGRPILSLRMLGRLTDEFSCANSRFFRTALYSNREVSGFLRKHFVLHWQSVRPVPRVTIDFGDGRKLERTLTGNSAHYVLAADGRPLDGLPGLYGPQAFQTWLARLSEFHRKFAAEGAEEQATMLAAFHRERRVQVYRQWAGDLERLGAAPARLVATRIEQSIETAGLQKSTSPLAKAAALVAATKQVAETPLLRYAVFKGPWIEAGMDDGLWTALADLHRDEIKLDGASVEVIRQEFPAALKASKISISKARQEDPILRLARTFEDSMALDTVRNEYLLHRQIHEQFAEEAAMTKAAESLNEWVYAELFLTPSSDPWLGLAPTDAYTALENGGRMNATLSDDEGSGS
jgi:hypothetical protein